MKIRRFFLLLKRVLVSLLFLILFTALVNPGAWNNREIVIEDFESGQVILESYSGEDVDPMGWELNAGVTYQNSNWSLRLFGNTWKLQYIEPVQIDSGDVWQVAAFIDIPAEIQGFGISDGNNVIYYAFAGSQEVDPTDWVSVYQGSFPENQWNNYQLPIADDWLSRFGYLPVITQLVYINDKDNTTSGVIYFDQIVNISDDLPIAPKVTITFDRQNDFGEKGIEIQFNCEVNDPDSDEHEFIWDFGDGSGSTGQNPVHIFTVSDDHPYTVLLRVVDDTDQWGWASCRVEPTTGSSSYPLTLNFVGDIMLARSYESVGGIIPTLGVEAIFEPTRPFFGDAAAINIANLECPLTTYWQHHPTKSIYFKGSPENVQGLVYAGIDIVTLANNHTMDYLLPGMQETQAVLKENNIVFSGGGVNSSEAYLPAFYSKSGMNFAFLAASDRTGQYNNYQPFLNAGYNKPGFANLEEYYIKKQIDEVKGISDLIIIEWHAGIEYSFNPGAADENQLPFAGDTDEEESYSPLAVSPSRSEIQIRHFAIDNGADLVICHHPHIMQAVEVYKGKLIAHSLGDFVFDLNYPETYPSFILNAEADGSGFSKFTLTPVYIDDYIPLRAQGELGLHILDNLAQSSKDLNTCLKIDRENVTAEVILDSLNVSITETEFVASLDMEESNGTWLSPPYHIQKQGSLSSVNYIKPQGNYEFRAGKEDIWFGNMEDEGCTLWNLNSVDESYCDTLAFAGERSIQQVRDESAPYNIVTNFEERIVCPSDTLQFTLCGYIKTLNGSDVTIEIQYFEDRTGGTPIGQQNLGTLVNGDTPWTFYHKNLTIPAGTEFFDIRLNSNFPQSGLALSWFDNVSLICWDTWGKYELSEMIPVPNDYYFLQVKSYENQAEVEINYSESVFEDVVVHLDESENSFTAATLLEQNTPNPFNPEAGATNISFQLSKASNVNLSVYDIKGQCIRILTNKMFRAGRHTLYWDGKNQQGKVADSGVYFYGIETPYKKEFKKCMLFGF
ncbi:MAG: CapA family protein [Bacteroidales bacterium]|nr:CapA family protein [Bacteroidales bacterium]